MEKSRDPAPRAMEEDKLKLARRPPISWSSWSTFPKCRFWRAKEVPDILLEFPAIQDGFRAPYLRGFTRVTPLNTPSPLAWFHGLIGERAEWLSSSFHHRARPSSACLPRNKATLLLLPPALATASSLPWMPLIKQGFGCHTREIFGSSKGGSSKRRRRIRI